MNDKEQQIHAICNHHFCIYSAPADKVLECLDTRQLEATRFDELFDWSFLLSEEGTPERRFLLFDATGEWTYVRWNIMAFSDAKKTALQLSGRLGAKVYYFFIDPWIFTCCWVLAEEGRLIRSYLECAGEILETEGSLPIEDRIRQELAEEEKEDEFWEDKFWMLYESVCVPIEILNEQIPVNAFQGSLNL